MKTLAPLLSVLFFISHSCAAPWSFAQTQTTNAEKDKQLHLKADLVQLRAAVTDRRGRLAVSRRKISS